MPVRSLSRRHLLQRLAYIAGAPIGAAGMLTFTAGEGLLSGSRKLKLRSAYDLTGALPHGSAAMVFQNMVFLLSGGELSIDWMPGGDQSDPLNLLTDVQSSKVDGLFGNSSLWGGKIRGSTTFSWLPYGMSGAAFDQWLKLDGERLWSQLYLEHGLVPIVMGRSGPIAGNWFVEPIHSLSDFSGLTVFSRTQYARSLAKFGAKEFNSAATKQSYRWLGKGLTPNAADAFIMALRAARNGEVQVFDWTSPHFDLKTETPNLFGTYQTITNLATEHWPVVNYELVLAEQKWSQLTRPHQQVIRTAARFSTLLMARQWSYLDRISNEKLVEQGLRETRFLPWNEEQKIHQAVKESMYAGARRPLETRILDSYFSFLHENTQKLLLS